MRAGVLFLGTVLAVGLRAMAAPSDSCSAVKASCKSGQYNASCKSGQADPAGYFAGLCSLPRYLRQDAALLFRKYSTLFDYGPQGKARRALTVNSCV